MTYLTIHHLDGKECFGKSIQKTLYAAQKLSLFEWLREFNPCGKIHYYALAAFNDINIENIKSIVMMVSRKYKSAKLN